jgi:Domain of unknown function (DUF4375)
MLKAFILLGIFFSTICCGPQNKKNATSQVISNPTFQKKKMKLVIIDDSVIGRNDPMEVIDPLWWSVDIYDSKTKYENDLIPYSLYQRAVFAVMWYMSEVNNGGHSQFYSNSTGIVWEDAKNGFKLMGLIEAMNIIEESVKRFGTAPSFDRIIREQQLDNLNNDFEDLDNRFYDLDKKIDLTDKIAAFIKNNKQQFYFKGTIEVPE